jgi:hypothetical protein
VKNLEFVVLGAVKELFMLRSMKKIKHYIQYKQKVLVDVLLFSVLITLREMKIMQILGV